MALQEKYKLYLANPTVDSLAADVSLNYVPTTTALEKPTAILKHLNAQKQLVEKSDEKFLNVIEGVNSLCVETETTLQFSHGGGTYLPGLDDNFIAGRTVTIPITHIVIFNEEQKIKQIRLLWDQACLLKAVDTIGARGRNWPIRDGKDQIKMIASSAAAAPTPAPSDDRSGRPRTRGVDPHSSLSLFENRTAHDREESQPNMVAPRESAKPTQRDFGEIFAGQEPIGSPERSVSPNKRDRENSNPLKGGAGQNFRESRLFNHEEGQAALKGPSIKTQPKKFDHFEFGESEFKVPQTPASKVKKTNQASWDFESFHTPDKPPARNLLHHKPNFDWQTDATVPDAKPPVFLPHVSHARRDADPHFQFEDPAAANAESNERPKTGSSSRSDLYEDNVHGGDDGTYGGKVASGQKMPLKNITNPNVHNKTFGSHFDNDNSVPSQQKENGKQTSKGRARKDAENGWDFLSDAPPPQTEGKTRGINIAGDGMGSRKTGEKNWWEEGF